MRSLLAVAALAVSGCATIDVAHQPPPADWPRLEVREHVVGLGAMLSRCYPALTLGEKLIGSLPLACAWIDLAQRTCDIYLTSWAPAGVREHELEHCLGADHVGSTQLADLLRTWRAAGGR